MTTGKAANPKLTPAQQRLLQLLALKWTAYCPYGDVVTVNGQKVGSRSTMDVLERHGLVARKTSSTWVATDSGRSLCDQNPQWDKPGHLR